MPRSIAFLLYEQLTLLDLVGPYELLARLPETKAYLVAKLPAAVRTDLGIEIFPHLTFSASPQFDVILVPGGPGQQALMEDEETLSFIRRQADTATYIVSVCTGSLVLAAAGLLKGYRATTHWSAMEALGELGAIPVHERVVIDRNRITGAGVSAGIDLALQLVALLDSAECARELQLAVEYYPSPEFNCAGAHAVPSELLNKARSRRQDLISSRIATARRVRARLDEP
ncbi:MAG: DJ-1/PfpI family protein [Candidatus Obscuribacterales bacterium]|nr:DJ-1/PfpI family protein [Candidatus Obscuribacterales bacterium]